MNEFILQTEKVSYAYEEGEGLALREVSLGFRAGEMTAVLGHNGSGKSTLAKLLNGLYIPTEGKVTVCGMDTSDDAHTEKCWHGLSKSGQSASGIYCA